jgi:flavin reductase (DIM6/NTAB) family NADH-FMN oxidoreductase RutF
MAKRIVDYRDAMAQTVTAFNENRVLLVSQGKNDIPNVMAIGWGTIGIVWRKPVFSVLVRPSRYTYKLLNETGEFTVNVVPPQMKEVVEYCGTLSGRDHDKFKERQLTAIRSAKVKIPIIKECILHFECRVLAKNDLIPSEIADPVKSRFYPKGDLHRIFFGEILACQAEV